MKQQRPNCPSSQHSNLPARKKFASPSLPFLSVVSSISCSSTCLNKDLSGLCVGPCLTDCLVLEVQLRLQITCLIQRNLTLRFLSVIRQLLGTLVVSLARQIPLPRPQPVDCSDQVPTTLHPRQQIRSATRAQREGVCSLVVGEVVWGLAAIYLVEGQISRLVDLVGALVRRRATIHLVDSLEVDRQGNRRMHPQAAPRLHLDSPASLRRTKLLNQQRQDQVKRLVCSAARAALGPSPLAI